MAMPASPAATDFFLANFHLRGPFFFIFSQNLSHLFSPEIAVAMAGSCVSPQNKISHPAFCHRQLIQVPMLCAHGIEISFQNVSLCIIIVREIHICGYRELLW